MKSALPKAAHPMCGRPVGRHVVEACRSAGIERIAAIVGHQAEAVKAALGDDVEHIVQSEQLGTGHAARCAEQALANVDYVAVFPADTPLILPGTIRAMLDDCIASDSAATLLSALLDDAAMYGRILRDPASSHVTAIVEAKDAAPEVLAIKEICTSIYAFRVRDLMPALHQLRSDNRQQEYYLTDVIGIFSASGKKVNAYVAPDSTEALGINTRVELAEATAVMRRRILNDLMLGGVTMIDPASVYADVGVTIEPDTVVYPNTILQGSTTIAGSCSIGPNARISNSAIGQGVTIENAVIEDSTVAAHSRIGPFARIRPGSEIGRAVKIGNFVEVKNSRVADEVSASHLSYLGDADVGQRTNIGAGTITCNYDGKRKHRTTIGANAFIGSNTILNAPVEVGDGALTGSGSVITKDIPPDALGISRPQLIIKEGWAKRRRETQ
ncbi:MAG: bifunctional UDP-N-acetylglucosamine diphosphorylase/glucosamine-1-phosphate N-acetyltransferase GlmU [Armatimonadetes bacterium]|nr:bifunctional UDP-N-acetylglucosamine diphosphorylase/glucosamine-1-phosphate N-acetyltransferase GlmU [Armatimonadota bacterium]